MRNAPQTSGVKGRHARASESRLADNESIVKGRVEAIRSFDCRC
jgi:hypothetical protein